MAKIPTYDDPNIGNYTIPRNNYADWRGLFLQVHGYPESVWKEVESASESSRATIAHWREKIDDALMVLPRVGTDVSVEQIENRIRQGDLIAPESFDGEQIRFLRMQSADAGLTALIQKLEQQSYNRQSRTRGLANFSQILEPRLRRLETRQDEAAALMASFMATAENINKSELARKSDAETTKLASQRWFEERQVALEAQTKDLELRAEGIKDQLDKWFKDKEADISSAKEALRTSFATESAHTYWAKDKFARHSDLALATRRIGYAYMAVVLLAAGAALHFGSHLNQPLWQTPLAVAIPFAVIVVGAIWVGRILGRTYMAHVQLAEDAKERATMIETYIALIRADVIDKSKADEAQKALFRPASTGLLAGDSGPDTPIEVITKAVSGNR